MGTSYNANIVTDGLELCLDAANLRSYPLSGDIWYDLSGNSNDGDLSTGNMGIGNWTNNYFHTDGLDEYLDFTNNNLKSLTQGSVELWFKSNNTGTLLSFYTDVYNYFVIWTGDSTGLWPDESIRIIYRSNTNYYYNYAERKGNNFYADNKWHQCVFTVDNNGNKLYVDKRQCVVEQWNFSIEGLSSTRWLSGLNPSTMAIARRMDNYVSMDFSNLRIYNRALSASEVQQNFNTTRGRYGI